MVEPNPELVNRRGLLRRLVAGAVAAVGATLVTLTGGAVLVTGTRRNGTWIPAGTLPDFGPDEPTPVALQTYRQDGWFTKRERRIVFVTRTTEGRVTVFSPVCPHLGCHVTWQVAKGQFHCPCHGGVFDRHGAVIAGPPPTPLMTVEAKVDGETILVKL